jgi:phosphoglycerate dehydrogenase-like enzyme
MPLTLLVVANPAASHLKALKALPDEINLIVTNDPAEIQARAPEADALLNTVHQGKLFGDAVTHATRARWMHSLFTGVEGVLVPEVVASPLPLTNGRGVFRVPLAEWSVGAMLYFSYDLRRLIRQQERGVWQSFDVETLHGRTLGVVGYGGIGSAAAERARAFGMKIGALRRRPELFANDPRVDQFFSPAQLRELMGWSDYVLLATPLTNETRGMIGEAEIAAMKPTGVLINVGRGQVVDESTLVHALMENKIRGAALDVFAVEPLPAAHAFYSLRNVLLSPHCADHVVNFLDLAYEAFFENLDRFRKGEPLEYVVDKHAGY